MTIQQSVHPTIARRNQNKQITIYPFGKKMFVMTLVA